MSPMKRITLILILVLVASKHVDAATTVFGTTVARQSQLSLLYVRAKTMKTLRPSPKLRTRDDDKRRRRRRKRRRRRPRCGIRRLAYATRIVGGRTAPWASSYNAVLFHGLKRCSGSVIAARWILTAAHCPITKGDLVIVGGASASAGGRRRVAAIHRHPHFRRSRTSVLSDLMLVRLNVPIGRSARPILLNSELYSPHGGAIVRATGYGRDLHRRHGPLRAIDVDNVSVKLCRRFFRNAGMSALAAGLSSRHHICANHDVCGAGVCFGDSGGPLVARDRRGQLVQIGVTSYGGPHCGSRETPDIYARVAFFRLWIQHVTRNSAKFIRLRAV